MTFLREQYFLWTHDVFAKFEFLESAQYLEKVENSSFFCTNYVIAEFVPCQSQSKHTSYINYCDF